MAIFVQADDLEDVYHDNQTLQQFYKYVNSLLNGVGGVVVMHSNNPNLLEPFDQKVDEKLSGLISDGSMYHDVFERSYFDNAHLVYRIKPRERPRPYSTLDFKTKTSANKGKLVPSYVQMSVWLKKLSAEPNDSSESANEGHMEFINGKEVFIIKDNERESFQESTTIQAKSLTTKKHEHAEHCWEKMDLNEYISAFTKIRGGGSVYFGVAEDYGITKKHRVKTVKFITKPIQMTEEERVRFFRGIRERVENKLKWVGAKGPCYPVQVFFHHVANAQADHCVIEVKVNYYHGLCFHDKDGPESYRIKGPGDPRTEPEIHRIPLDDWVKSFNVNAAEKMKAYEPVWPGC